jgi:hypothetical protein
MLASLRLCWHCRRDTNTNCERAVECLRSATYSPGNEGHTRGPMLRVRRG